MTTPHDGSNDCPVEPGDYYGTPSEGDPALPDDSQDYFEDVLARNDEPLGTVADVYGAPAEERTPAQILNLPDDIPTLLDTALTPADMPGAETEKFDVAGRPDLLVRRNVPESVAEALQAHDMAQHIGDSYNVHVLPALATLHDGDMFTITARVDGTPLDELLHTNPDPELIAQVDAHYAEIGTYYTGEASQGRPTVPDIHSPGQVMRGTISADATPKLWLVDFPTMVSDAADYTHDIMMLTNNVIKLEGMAAARLPQARASIERAIEIIPQLTNEAERAEHLIRHALATDTLIDDDATGLM